MKRYILTITCCLLFGTMALCQGISFSKLSFEEAKAKATKENKNIMVDVYTSWCGPCKKMAAEVFPQKEVGTYFNANFVCLSLDGEKETEHGFFKKYNATSYPSFFWLNGKGELLDITTGYKGSAAFIDEAKKAVSSNLAKKAASYKERWDKGERSLDLVNNYVLGIMPKLDPKANVREYVESYLRTQSNEQLKSFDNFQIVRRFMRSPQKGVITDCILKNTTTYEQYLPYPEFRVSLYRMLIRAGNAYLAEKDTAALIRHKELLKDAVFENKTMYVELFDMEQTLNTAQYADGFKKMVALGDKYGKSDPYLFREFCYSLIVSGYLKKAVKSESDLNQVISIASKAYELTPSKETAYFLSIAYSTAGDYQKAFETAMTMAYLPDPALPAGIGNSYLGIKSKVSTDFGKTEECKEMKEKYQQPELKVRQ